jgi:hypothetical protein
MSIHARLGFSIRISREATRLENERLLPACGTVCWTSASGPTSAFRLRPVAQTDIVMTGVGGTGATFNRQGPGLSRFRHIVPFSREDDEAGTIAPVAPVLVILL